MNPRSMAALQEIENAAAEVHRHVHGAANYATSGDFHRAHGEAERAQGAARKLKELLGHSPAAERTCSSRER